MRLQRVILAKSQLAAVIWGASLTMAPSLLFADERPAAAAGSTSAAWRRLAWKAALALTSTPMANATLWQRFSLPRHFDDDHAA